MRSSQSGLFRTKNPWAASRILVACLLIVCSCVASYLAGLHAATCRLTGPPPHTTTLRAVELGRALAGRHTSHHSVPGKLPDQGHNSTEHAPAGRHILLEYYEAPRHLLNALADTAVLHQILASLITQAGMNLLGHSCHTFESQQGITCVFLLSESHLSIHTWPEHGYAALDVFTCGVSSHPEVVEQGLHELLQPKLVVRQELARGGLDLSKLTPEQQQAKVLHTFTTSSEDGESLQQQLYQVPVIHSSSSQYQSITVIEVPGQLGRCLLLDGVIQFCSKDLDAYTDHMARHPLQLLQALQNCDTATGNGTNSTAGAAGVPAIAKLDLGPAGSSSTAGFVTCRASLLRPPHASTTRATTGNTTALPGCQTSQQGKLRVLLIGGGDGWIAWHLISCYGALVGSVTAVELDKAVSVVTEKYFKDMMRGGSPFQNPSIHWEYTDAFAWAMQRAANCSHRSGASPKGGEGSGMSSDASSPSTQTAPSAAAAEERRMRRGTKTLSTVTGSTKPSDCSAFDVVIIDSTDFTVQAASKLHSAPFYRALYQLMKPKASLIQIVEIYLRKFEKNFASMEEALRQAGWSGVGRSIVYAPSYSGEALMLHAVKQSKTG